LYVFIVVGTFVRSARRSARKTQSGDLRSECWRGNLTIANEACWILDGVIGKVDESKECPIIPVLYLTSALCQYNKIISSLVQVLLIL